MSLQLLLTVLSVISALVAAIIAGSYALRVKRNEYVNEYFKVVINKRIAAYEQLEKLIAALKATVVAEDENRPYHLLFASEKEDDWDRAFLLLHGVMSQGLWLSDEAFTATRDLNQVLFHFNKPPSVIEFGKNNYEAIATLRARLERLLAKDMLRLHDVRRFLRAKINLILVLNQSTSRSNSPEPRTRIVCALNHN